MLLLGIGSNDDTKLMMNTMLNGPTGAAILFSHHQTQDMTLNHLPAQVFSRLLEDRGLSEFIFTDFFQRSSLPLTSKQAARACVALTSDLKLMAASATCARNQAVLFVRGQCTPIVFDTGTTTNVSNDPADFINWEQEGDCGAIERLTGQTRIKEIGTV